MVSNYSKEYQNAIHNIPALYGFLFEVKVGLQKKQYSAVCDLGQVCISISQCFASFVIRFG